jgi:hypothetical protein
MLSKETRAQGLLGPAPNHCNGASRFLASSWRARLIFIAGRGLLVMDIFIF